MTSLSRAEAPRFGLGLKLFLLSGAMGLAAVNTGNNLIYLMLSLALGLVTCSAVAGRWSLRHLNLRLHLPRQVSSDEPFVLRAEAEGRFPLLPRTWVDIRVEGLPEPLDICVAVPGDSGRGLASTRVVARKRGIYQHLTMRASTGYPFDLTQRRSRPMEAGEIVVLPRFTPIRSLRIGGGMGSGARQDVPAPLPGGAGTDLHDLREYTSSDDARHIAWRASARTHELMVREFEREEPRVSLDILLDTSADDPEQFEDVVSRCASILDFAEREKIRARLILPGQPSPLTGDDALRALAGVELSPGKERSGLSGLTPPRTGVERIVLSTNPDFATRLEMT